MKLVETKGEDVPELHVIVREVVSVPDTVGLATTFTVQVFLAPIETQVSASLSVKLVSSDRLKVQP